MTNKELQQQIEQLEQQIKDLKVKLEEECFLPYVPYEVEAPEDIEDYHILDGYGKVYSLEGFSMNYTRCQYERGLAFKTREQAEQFKKEQILLFKLHKWAEEHNGGWNPNLNDEYEKKYFIIYHVQDKIFEIFHTWHCNYFLKLPYFKTVEIAERFIEEFGEEIKEVLL